MIWTAIICGTLWFVFWWLVDDAPEGWGDDDGFHSKDD